MIPYSCSELNNKNTFRWKRKLHNREVGVNPTQFTSTVNGDNEQKATGKPGRRSANEP
jgi:hypothetical protein